MAYRCVAPLKDSLQVGGLPLLLLSPPPPPPPLVAAAAAAAAAGADTPGSLIRRGAAQRMCDKRPWGAALHHLLVFALRPHPILC